MSSIDADRHMHQITGAMSALMQPSLHEPYDEPVKAARTGFSSEAAEYLERSRGTLLIIGTGNGRHIDDCAGGGSVRGPRILGRDGSDNLQRSRNGTVGHLIAPDGSASSRSGVDVAVPRVKGADGEDILRRSVNGTMAKLLDAERNRTYSSPRPAPRIPTDEAEANATRNRGVMHKVLDTEVNRDYRSARPCGPHVLPGEGETNALNGRGTMNVVLAHTAAVENARRKTSSVQDNGSQMATRGWEDDAELARNRRSLLGMVLAGQVPGTPACDVRVKGESGHQNYEAGTRGTLGTLLANYSRVQQSVGGGDDTGASRPPSRVNGPGTDIASYGKTGTLHRLLNSYGQLPTSGRPEPRVKPEAQRTASKSSGKNMADHINPYRKPAKRPTRRKLGLSKQPRPQTAAVAFGRTLDKPSTTSATTANYSRPKTASAAV